MNASVKENNEDEALQPIPGYIKIGGMGVAALLVIIIGWFVFPISSEEDAVSDVKTLKLSEIESSDDIELEVDPLIPVNTPTPDVFSKADDSSVNTTQYASSPDHTKADETEFFAAQSSGTDLKISAMENQINQLILENNTRQQDQDELIQELSTRINSQSVQIEQLQTNLKSRKTTFRPRKKIGRAVKITLPFTLVSVDQWGDSTYAVVSSLGRLYELTAGQYIKNWQVQSIDRSRGTVVFENSKGTHKKLFVES